MRRAPAPRPQLQVPAKALSITPPRIESPKSVPPRLIAARTPMSPQRMSPSRSLQPTKAGVKVFSWESLPNNEPTKVPRPAVAPLLARRSAEELHHLRSDINYFQLAAAAPSTASPAGGAVTKRSIALGSAPKATQHALVPFLADIEPPNALVRDQQKALVTRHLIRSRATSTPRWLSMPMSSRASELHSAPMRLEGQAM
jgi:hypothetical protein